MYDFQQLVRCIEYIFLQDENFESWGISSP